MPTIEVNSPLALAVAAPVRIDIPADQLPKGDLLVLRSAPGAPASPRSGTAAARSSR